MFSKDGITQSGLCSVPPEDGPILGPALPPISSNDTCCIVISRHSKNPKKPASDDEFHRNFLESSCEMAITSYQVLQLFFGASARFHSDQHFCDWTHLKSGEAPTLHRIFRQSLPPFEECPNIMNDKIENTIPKFCVIAMGIDGFPTSTARFQLWVGPQLLLSTLHIHLWIGGWPSEPECRLMRDTNPS